MTVGQPVDILSRLSSTASSSGLRGAEGADPKQVVGFGILPASDRFGSFQGLLDRSRKDTARDAVADIGYFQPIYSPGEAGPKNGILPENSPDSRSRVDSHPPARSDASANSAVDLTRSPMRTEPSVDRGAGRDSGSTPQSTQTEKEKTSDSSGNTPDGAAEASGKSSAESKPKNADRKTSNGGQAGEVTSRENDTNRASASGAAKRIGRALIAGIANAAAVGSSAAGKVGGASQNAEGELSSGGSPVLHLREAKIGKLIVQDMRSMAGKTATGKTLTVQLAIEQVQKLISGDAQAKVAAVGKHTPQKLDSKKATESNSVQALKQNGSFDTVKQALVEHAAGNHAGNDHTGPQSGSDNGQKFHFGTETQALTRQSGSSTPAAAAPGAYSELARQLQDNLKGDIVREAKVVLRDQNSGEIRMTLRPESLGRVRIQLHVVENRIDGRIYVDNVNVRDVFQQNLSQLYQAFRDSGFETGMLEVAVGNGGDQTSGKDNGAKDSSSPRRILPSAVGALESSVPRLGDAVYASSTVNLVV